MDTAGRYAIGALIGAAIATMVMWHVGERRLAAWVAAAQIQQANERARVAAINERTIDGYSAAVAYLRDRLLAGQRSRPPGVPACRVPEPTGGADGRTSGDLDGAGGLAAGLRLHGSGQVILDTCRADYDRLYDDAALTTLQLLTLQHWHRSVAGQ